MTSMRASVLTAPKTIEVEERPVPSPGPTRCWSGWGRWGCAGPTCTTTATAASATSWSTSRSSSATRSGGRIVEVGELVDRGRIGERVALEPQRPCRRCRQCKTGHLNLCADMQFFATPPIDGAFCDYVVLPADFAHPVPDSMSEAAVALCEPLSVGLWANEKGGTTAGSRVFVTGAGPIGALCALAARARGATEIVVSDPVESRRIRIAELTGATTVDPTDGFDASEVGADVFLECSGATPALQQGLAAVRPGGVAVMVGHGDSEVTLPLIHMQMREVWLTGIFRYVDTWPVAISLVSSGVVDLDALVTARFDLDHVEDALTSDDDPQSMKSVVEVNQDTA